MLRLSEAGKAHSTRRNVYTVTRVLGHSSVSITGGLYGHATDAGQREAMTKLAEAIGLGTACGAGGGIAPNPDPIVERSSSDSPADQAVSWSG
jgi:hypothetical protein